MRTILVSQRVEVFVSRNERRDCLDQRIPALLATLGLRAVPVPNVPALLEGFWWAERPDGVLLTGGNDLGEVPERDETEHRLLGLAVAQQIPVLGFCRGMQMIASCFGGTLEPVEGHVATRHRVTGAWGDYEVNSFHGWAPASLPSQLTATMHAEDGSVEGIEHVDLPIRAVMWHPEREPVLAQQDRALIEGVFGMVRA